ncbi:hypothetical protein PHYBOEH_008180 [Phytophthora boehmeriae]|uniref:RxLR effector protein n=1 Tax=Phytophthora boehmeriae TaxID=109152 RepID=A0A8T1W2Y6_9STRA|nr:hypothetical protein PHYBOEH_008180 [Phytophthora boehmeriae]
MRVCFYLIAATTVLLSRVDVVFAVSDRGHAPISTKNSVDSLSVTNGRDRFLRTTNIIKDGEAGSEYDSDDDTEGEERNIQDLISRASFKTLDKVAEDLPGVPGAAKYLNGQNDELLKTIAARKWTPETMKAELGIAAKKASTSRDQLKYDSDYLLYRAYKKFWNERRAQA